MDDSIGSVYRGQNTSVVDRYLAVLVLYFDKISGCLVEVHSIFKQVVFVGSRSRVMVNDADEGAFVFWFMQVFNDSFGQRFKGSACCNSDRNRGLRLCPKPLVAPTANTCLIFESDLKAGSNWFLCSPIQFESFSSSVRC